MTATKGSDGTTSATKGKAAREAAHAILFVVLQRKNDCGDDEFLAAHPNGHLWYCNKLTEYIEADRSQLAAIHEEELRGLREILEDEIDEWSRVEGAAHRADPDGVSKTWGDIEGTAFRRSVEIRRALGASQQTGTPPAVGSPLCWDCGQGWPGVDTGVLGNGERICVNCKCPTNREVLGDGPPAESETAETCRRCKGAGTTPGSYYHAEGLCGDMPCPDCGGSGTTKGGTR
jgi:hypothetical protein